MMGINAVKGVEIGAGFASVTQRGTTHGDSLTPQGFAGNNAGGVLGGISTGQDLEVSIAIKPTSSILSPRERIDVARPAGAGGHQGPPRPLRGHPRHADRRGHAGPGGDGPRAAPPRAERRRPGAAAGHRRLLPLTRGPGPPALPIGSGSPCAARPDALVTAPTLHEVLLNRRGKARLVGSYGLPEPVAWSVEVVFGEVSPDWAIAHTLQEPVRILMPTPEPPQPQASPPKPTGVGRLPMPQDLARLAATLQESEERLQLALEAGGLGVWQVDLETGRHTWWPGMERLHGLPPGTQPLHGEAYFEAIDPRDRDKVRAAVARIRRQDRLAPRRVPGALAGRRGALDRGSRPRAPRRCRQGAVHVRRVRGRHAAQAHRA